jgi:flagellar hook-length control protein FliK
MHIQLKPDVLGGARILVETLQNQISVKILVDKPETRHALEQHVQALHAAVAQQSGRVQEIQISIHVQSDATSQNQAQSNQGQNQHSGTSQENGQNRSFPTGYGKDTEARDDQKRMRQFGYNSMEKVA